ncbi:hypothetical protein KC19_2G211900 [Ceratodon purpureus]|uniref:Uncharacterized protein n=1 Tax=Ceratodon purpureus TaxID=3225 RepID=A0A8T0IYI2_CERPU|nr:hypothetical protein KC19_2G211900 [Ceratodon purpureus]
MPSHTKMLHNHTLHHPPSGTRHKKTLHLITAVETMGLDEGLMQTVAKRCRKAKKVKLRKKCGSTVKSRRQYDTS